MKTFYSILALFILTSTPSFAQYKKLKKLTDDTKTLLERPLKVVLMNEGKEKKDTYNKFMKSAIKSEWTLNKDYSFISRDEYKKLIKEKSQDYAFLVMETKANTDISKKSASKILSENGGVMKYDASTMERTTTFNDQISLVGFNKKGEKIRTIPNDICYGRSCTKADYYFSVQRLQLNLYALENAAKTSGKKMKMKDARAMMQKAQREQQENIKKLKSMTLYVNEKSINEKLKDNFGKYYKYGFRIVSIEDIETAVIENNKEIAILSSDKISSADTGFPLLGFMDMKKMRSVNISLGANPLNLFSHEIQKKDLQRLKDVLK